VNTAELLARLQRHYIKPGEQWPGGIFLPECGWNGGGQSSRCDAVYVGFTSSSGRRLIGHELKVSRADWRKELDSPGKADPWHDNCHAWFVVAPSEEVVPVEEVPAGWGLLLPGRSKTRMQVKVRPTYRELTPSWDACRSLMSRQDTLRGQAVAEERWQIRQREQAVERREQQRATAGDGLSQHDRERLELLTRMEEELEGLGIKLATYSWASDEQATPEQLRAALQLVRMARRMGPSGDRWAVESLRRSAQGIVEELDQFAETLALLHKLAGDGRHGA
jgi:hypothetical protein